MPFPADAKIAFIDVNQVAGTSAAGKDASQKLTACLARARPRWARTMLSRPYLSDAQAYDATLAMKGRDSCTPGFAEVEVTFRTSLTKHIAHPKAGPLTFGIESVIGPHDPHQRLVVYTVEPGSPTAAVLPMLASWATETARG